MSEQPKPSSEPFNRREIRNIAVASALMLSLAFSAARTARNIEDYRHLGQQPEISLDPSSWAGTPLADGIINIFDITPPTN